MANKIEYTRKEIINNQSKKVFITIIRLICDNQCTEENRIGVLENAVQKKMNFRPYKLFKDDENYEYVIIENENELKLVETVVGDARDTLALSKTIKEGKFDSVINCIGILNQFAEQHIVLQVIN